MQASDSSALSRRDALKILGATVAATGLGLGKVSAAAAGGELGWDLPPLGFGYDALEPHIDARTMEIHYTKHHQAYITNARKLLEPHQDLLSRGPEALARDLASVPESIRTGVRNNVGGHVNHSFFWKLIAPAQAVSVGQVGVAIARDFGSMDEFKTKFADAAMKRFGSGWAWLSVKSDGKLLVHSTPNQDSPLSEGLTPVIGLDVWEHAYYLHYQNRRADYVAAFWNVLNWTQADSNYHASGRS